MLYKVPDTRDNRRMIGHTGSGDDHLPGSVARWASDGKRSGLRCGLVRADVLFLS